MFCRELFGKKPQKLEFGLQPHKIPDCDVVSSRIVTFTNLECSLAVFRFASAFRCLFISVADMFCFSVF